MFTPALLLAALAVSPLQQGAPQQKPPKQKRAAVPEIPKDTEVVTTASGLKYCVLTTGTGSDHPKIDDKIKVHYTGWNTDGSVFDSSRQNAEPAEYVLGMMIEGWIEAIQLMTPGAHWKLTVPPALAYGDTGSGADIKPNATLIFEVELLGINPGPPLPAFHPGDPKKQQKNESGLVWETLVEGKGPAPKPDDLIDFNFAFWNTEGHLIGCSEIQGHSTRGCSSRFNLRFLQLMPQYVKQGDRTRFVVPAELCDGLQWKKPYLPPGSTTVWEIELLKVTEIHLPPFVSPDPAKQTKTASGLLYEVLKEGTGLPAKPGAVVHLYYVGWFPDGRTFDESYSHPEPATFQLVEGRKRGSAPTPIKGLLEGIQLMKEGAIYRFQLPPDLAYGPRGFPPQVPPDATLIFQVELVKVGQ